LRDPDELRSEPTSYLAPGILCREWPDHSAVVRDNPEESQEARPR
jgi:hypothetical protein